MTDKKDLLKLQEDFPPFGLDPKYHRYIRRIHRTSGTTAKPLVIAMNDIDIEAITQVGAKCFRNAGIIDGMRVVHCLNYAGWTGGYTDHASLERAGASVLPWGVGNTEQLIQMILDLNFEAISCTPSYLGVLKKVLKENFGMNPKQLKIKLGLFGGEAGLQNSSFRERIENEWEMDAIDANYGMADVMSIFASENRLLKDGLIFMASEYLDAKLLINGVLCPVESNMVGELVLSTKYDGGFIKRSDYRTGDLINVISQGENFKFRILGRSDEMIVVRGINLYPSTIFDIVNKVIVEFDTELTWQLLVSKEDPISEAILTISSIDTNKEILRCISDLIKSRTGLSIEIKLIDKHIISDNMKIKSIVRCL